jgi:hypothetical protein
MGTLFEIIRDMLAFCGAASGVLALLLLGDFKHQMRSRMRRLRIAMGFEREFDEDI